MTGLASWWVALASREEDARPLALVRIGVALAALLDLLRAAQLGLVGVVFQTYEHGGLSQKQDPGYVLNLLWDSPLVGPTVWAVTVVCMGLVAAGVATRPATLLGVLTYAQLGHLYPPGDRAIDRILRTLLLILMCSDAHRRLALGGGAALARIRAWPGDLIRNFLIIIYLSAGLGKVMQQPAWLSMSGTPVLYRVMTDPLSAHLDPEVALPGWWLFRVMGWATIALELSAPLLYTRLAPLWAVFGVVMHVGIYVTMDLGMFSWGMLSTYPLVLAPWWLPVWDRWTSEGAHPTIRKGGYGP
ncbi:MAG TPA: HTTM domain-containing protein [Myxococcota bacterium]|nr:HTTM domain-containing protein [Myxococcota bacterium]